MTDYSLYIKQNQTDDDVFEVVERNRYFDMLLGTVVGIDLYCSIDGNRATKKDVSKMFEGSERIYLTLELSTKDPHSE